MSRFRFVPRLPDSETRLPLALAVVLTVAAVAQLADTGAVELPSAGALGGGARRVVEQGGVPTTPAAALGPRQLFAPTRTAASAGAVEGAVAADPLGGVRIAGSVTIGRRSYAIAVRPGQPPRRVPVGGVVGEWRLVALQPGAAVLRRGGERLEVPFGAQAAVAPPPPDGDGEVQ